MFNREGFWGPARSRLELSRRARVSSGSWGFRPAAEEGYASIDALVALTIFTTTIVFAIVAIHVANQGAKAALEAHQANEALKTLLEQATTTAGTVYGTGQRFSWQLSVQTPVLVAGAAALCEQDALVIAKATGRRYRAASARICPSDGAQ